VPYENEHSCRLEEPGQYKRFTRGECDQKHDGKCIDVIYGWKTEDGEEKSEIQALRYDKEVWTEASARSHCKSRGGMFEAAKKEDKAADEDKPYRCECIDCGYQMDSEKHCRDIECPECGGEMRRVERPGPGQKTKQEQKMTAKKSYSRSPFMPRGQIDLKIVNKDSPDEATIYIYDEISWFGINAEQFIKELNDIKAKTTHIRFNTPGGSVFDGTAVFNAIKEHKSKTITHIDGLAASIASVIALASDEVRMAENAFLMIHDPWSIVIGNADTMREEADLLDKIGGTIAKTYMDKTGKDEKEIKSLMNAETWMTAEEAKEMGFIDIIDEAKKEEKAKATLFDLSVFANVPDQLMGEKQKPTARDLERALRDAGCSSKAAKAILAEGYKDDLRDEDKPDPPDAKAVQRDVETEGQRDVEKPEPKKKDRTADILTRAEVIAPSNA
jgi:ATP-dependent Clp protease, protease subunit